MKKIDKAYACNLCKNFRGYGFLWVSGKCEHHDGEISMSDYQKIAKYCEHYDSDFISCCSDCVLNETCSSCSSFCTACSKHKVE